MNPRIKRPPYPHITLLQPFVAPDYLESAKNDLRNVLKNINPFRLNFQNFELFINRGSTTLFLNPIITPPDALENLYNTLKSRYPEVQQAQKKPSDFEPHIGVGFFRDQGEAKTLQTKYQRGWKPIDFVVKEIYIVSRISQDTPFEVRKVIPIGANTTTPHFKEKPL